MKKHLISVSTNIEKIQSLFQMSQTTLQMISEINEVKYASIIIKEYYDVIRELLSVIILLNGYKTAGEGAHKTLIEFLEKKYPQFSKQDIMFLDDLRILRNKISYFVSTILEVKKIAGIISKAKAQKSRLNGR